MGDMSLGLVPICDIIITGFYRRGEDLPQFHEILHSVVGEIELAYVQKHCHLNIHSSSELQVPGGQL
jgi:hypothetical protein